MMYLGFVEKLQRRIVAELDRLDAIYNFELATMVITDG